MELSGADTLWTPKKVSFTGAGRLKYPSPKIFYFLSETTPCWNNFCKKKIAIWTKDDFFLEFFKNVQICGHFGTPFVLVLSQSMASYDVL